jgi:hypothetical protein
MKLRVAKSSPVKAPGGYGINKLANASVHPDAEVAVKKIAESIKAQHLQTG